VTGISVVPQQQMFNFMHNYKARDNHEVYLPENEMFLDDSLDGFIRPHITI
jgi:hypothetical protein